MTDRNIKHIPRPAWVDVALRAGDCAAKFDETDGWSVYQLPVGKRLAEYPVVGEPRWVDA
jgi:hypothetical protein